MASLGLTGRGPFHEGISMSDVSRLIAVADAEVGTHEGYSNGHWNNNQKYSGEVPGLEWSNYQAWCQTFQSWIFQQAGLKALAPVTASCWTAVNWFKQRGRFSEYPAVGAQVFFGAGGATHVGVVASYDADYVYTIEGNTNTNGSAEGDGVYRRKRARRDDYLYGYGYPAFAEGSVSADPNAAQFGYKTKATGDVTDVGGEAPKPKPEYEPFPGAAFFKNGPRSAIVTAMGKRLVAEGCSAYSEGPGPNWTDADKRSYAKWQRKLGYSGADADGWPGKTSWDKLRVPKV